MPTRLSSLLLLLAAPAVNASSAAGCERSAVGNRRGDFRISILTVTFWSLLMQSQDLDSVSCLLFGLLSDLKSKTLGAKRTSLRPRVPRRVRRQQLFHSFLRRGGNPPCATCRTHQVRECATHHHFCELLGREFIVSLGGVADSQHGVGGGSVRDQSLCGVERASANAAVCAGPNIEMGGVKKRIVLARSAPTNHQVWFASTVWNSYIANIMQLTVVDATLEK